MWIREKHRKRVALHRGKIITRSVEKYLGSQRLLLKLCPFSMKPISWGAIAAVMANTIGRNGKQKVATIERGDQRAGECDVQQSGAPI